MTHGVSGYVQGCRCTPCVRGNYAYQRVNKQQRYDHGLCRRCRNKRLADRVLCLSCLEEARDYARLWREKQKAA